MNYKKHIGLLLTVSYYIVGLIVSYIVYLIYGWTYMHAPGRHHLIFVLFLIGGLFWSFYNIKQVISTKSAFHKESLLVHALVIGGLVSLFIVSVFGFNTARMDNPIEGEKSSVTIHKTDSTALVVNGNDTLFWKVGDHIIIDRMKE